MSPDTQAAILLTAALPTGGNAAGVLRPRELALLQRCLNERGAELADLIGSAAGDLLDDVADRFEPGRLPPLLARAALLRGLRERWESRAIWALSRADAAYPSRLRARMGDDAPAVLFGSGDAALLESGGLAVVGSRNAAPATQAWTTALGRACAEAGCAVVSGGARGIDQAAMTGAAESGCTVGVLADALESAVSRAGYRDWLPAGRAVLVTPYDPAAPFRAGLAMARNKLIYALADAALVVESDYNKGGTWGGATQQLRRLRYVPVYARQGDSEGLRALLRDGALPWPDPLDVTALLATAPPPPAAQLGLPFD